MTKTILKVLSFACFGAGVAALATEPPKVSSVPLPADSKAIVPMLEGDYTIVSGEKDGKPIPPERIRGSSVQITANAMTGSDKDKKEFFACTYTVDRTQTPWVIRMKSTGSKAGEEALGLIKKTGNTVTIVYALPGATMPTDFKTKEKQHLFVLQDVKAELPQKDISFVPPERPKPITR